VAERPLEVYCVLIPLAEGRLLLPRSCVAEVVAYAPPVSMPGAPAWYLGTVPWSARSVPLISFEGVCGQPVPPASGRSRIVVLHGIGDALEGGFLGLVSQGFPQVVRVTPEVIRADHSRSLPERWPALCHVRMMTEAPLVPDLERLEALVAEETSAGAG
jgi:chemosensory pili system protein ChpC